MEKRRLGTSDLEVSKVCLGTMTWGRQNTEVEGHEQMDYAVDNGVNFFDTAELYAVPASKETSFKTEEIIGNWFQKSGKRSDVILGTKIAGPGAYTAHIRVADDYSEKNIQEALEGSLRRLKTDYIDLYQIHWPARPTNRFGTRIYTHDPTWEDNILMIVEALEKQIKAGKILHYGISNESPWGTMRYLNYAKTDGKPRCMSIQNSYNLLNRQFEVGLGEIAIREKCGLLAYSPMAFGVLSGKYHRAQQPKEGRLIEFPNMLRYSSASANVATRKYLAIAEKYGLSLAEMSLAFVNDRPFVTSNIIGASSLEQLKENIGSANISLSKEILSEIDMVHLEIPDPAC